MSAFYDLNKTPRNILNQAIVRAIVSENSGALFDPSDMSTLYQDVAGTIPVTAVEQPVGLVLDKSQGLMLGPELVSNGTFDTNTIGWNETSPATISATSGELVLTNTSGRVQEQANYNLTPYVSAGKMYKVSALVRVGTATSYGVLVDGNSISIFYKLGYTNTEFQLISFYFTFPATQNYCVLRIRATGIGTVFADNISVREIYGNCATQSVTASRPVLSARKNILLATETLATQSVTTLAAQYTLSFTGNGSITLSGTAAGTLTGTGTDRVSLTFTPTDGTLTLTVSGSVTKAQLELGAVAGQYQRVATATDYDVSAHYYYLRFDGIDDYLNLPYMGLYVAGSASVVLSLYMLGGAIYRDVVSERNTGSVSAAYTPIRSTTTRSLIDGYIRDDSNVYRLDATDVNATNKVVSVIDTGNKFTIYSALSQVLSQSYTRSGTLTLNTTTIGASISTTLLSPIAMNLYSLIITKSALTDSQRVACERYLGRKSGVTL